MNTQKNSTKDKYCFIGIKCGLSKRGSYTVSKRMAEHLYQEFRPDTSFRSIEEEKDNYKKFIFTFQNINNYSFNFNIRNILKLEIPHLVYTRNDLHAKLLNSAQNGFSAYKNMRCHKHFIPFITDFGKDIITNINKFNSPVIGFYSREHVNPDAISFFKEEIKNSKYKIDLITCGSDAVNFSKVTNIKSHYHTYDNKEFFSKITHYYFPQSAEFMDPFPNVLLEAIQTNKQIICPKVPGRKHTDGIDDILQIIKKYSNKLEDAFTDKITDYSKINYLTYDNFEKFYKKIMLDDFNNPLDYDKFNSFEDWCGCQL